MRRNFSIRVATLFAIFASLSISANFYATTTKYATATHAMMQANVGLGGFFSLDKAPRGSTFQAAVVAKIPEGYHINGNRPLSKFSIPTVLKIEAPGGVRIGPITYARPVVRSFSFSKDKLAVYEGRTVMRFNVSVPANYQSDRVELRARLNYQSCNDEVCFPPTSRQTSMSIPVVAAKETGKRINGSVFGRRQ